MPEPGARRVVRRRKIITPVHVAVLFGAALISGIIVGGVVSRVSGGTQRDSLRRLGQTGQPHIWPAPFQPSQSNAPPFPLPGSSAPPVSGAENAPGPPPLANAAQPEGVSPDGPSASPTVVLAQPLAAQPSPQEVIARVKQSVVLVLVRTAAGWGSGSGVVLDSNRVATCAHVVQDAQQTLVLTSDGRQLNATVAAADPTDDVAVLVTGPGLPPAAALGNSDQAREGDEVAVTGFPVVDKFYAEGFAPTASTSRGSIGARRKQLVGGVLSERLQTDATMNPGNSGGPLYSLRDGSVIGLAQSMMAEERGLYFATTVNALRRLLGQQTR